MKPWEILLSDVSRKIIKKNTDVQTKSTKKKIDKKLFSL
jgi:hypothetical protein